MSCKKPDKKRLILIGPHDLEVFIIELNGDYAVSIDRIRKTVFPLLNEKELQIGTTD